MKLKHATLVAIVGCLIGLILSILNMFPSRELMQFVWGEPLRLGWIMSAINSACMLFFLVILFLKQK